MSSEYQLWLFQNLPYSDTAVPPTSCNGSVPGQTVHCSYTVLVTKSMTQRVKYCMESSGRTYKSNDSFFIQESKLFSNEFLYVTNI